jgi:hypothetical protein
VIVILRSSWLADRNLNINKYLTDAIKVFEDFKLMAEMRQEIDKLNNVVNLVQFTN